MKRIISILIIGLIWIGKTYSQDPHFSQYYSSPLYLSPSLAGASEDSRLIINYRNQWSKLPNAYNNYAISFDHYLRDYKSGIGALILRSQEGGAYNTTNAGLLYSYTINLNREIKIRPGIKASYYFRDFDQSSLDFADEITRDANVSIEQLDREKVSHWDFSSSALLYTSFYWLGITADHLLALNKQFADDPTYPSLKLSVYGGAQLKFFESVISKTDRTVSVSFLYKNQGSFHQLDLGAYYDEHPFRIGIFFRGIPVFKQEADLNAIVLMAGYTWQQFMINYSYDIATSRLLSSTGGAHEISLAYRFNIGWKGKSTKMGAVPCPQF